MDPLTILITGDISGIEGAMKKALNVVMGGVEAMNDQTVDWTAIFSRAVSPAIISSVASVLANAISQFVQFNDAAANLNNIATPAVQALGNSIGTVGGQVYSLAENSGSSLGDATSAYEAFSKAGLDNAAATYAVTEASGIARDTGESLSSVVSELVPLFQQWGVTTTPQVTTALTGLVNAAQNGTLSFDQLVQAISAQGAVLKGKTDIGSVAIQLAALSTQSGLTQQDVLNSFAAIAQGSANPLSQMSILVGNVSKAISSGPDGLITAFGMVQSKVNQWGPEVAQTMGQTIGLSANIVSDFGDQTQSNFTKAATAADKIRGSLVPLDKDISDNEPAMAKFVADWQKFSDIMASIVIPKILPGLDTLLNSLDSGLTAIQNLLNGTSTDKIGDWLKTGSLALGAGGVGSAALAGAGIGSGIGAFGGPADFVTIPLGAIIGALTGAGISLGALGALSAASQPGSSPFAAASSVASHSTTTNFQNTFNISAAGSGTMTAQQIQKILYNQYQGTQ